MSPQVGVLGAGSTARRGQFHVAGPGSGSAGVPGGAAPQEVARKLLRPVQLVDKQTDCGAACRGRNKSMCPASRPRWAAPLPSATLASVPAATHSQSRRRRSHLFPTASSSIEGTRPTCSGVVDSGTTNGINWTVSAENYTITATWDGDRRGPRGQRHGDLDGDALDADDSGYPGVSVRSVSGFAVLASRLYAALWRRAACPQGPRQSQPTGLL